VADNRDNKSFFQPAQRPSPAPSPARAPIPLTYTCAAHPPEYIDIHTLNLFGRDNEGFYWEAAGKKYYAEIDFIRMLFSPKSMTWEEAMKIVK
jgi:hypothetical protein